MAAYEIPGRRFTYEAGADLSTKLFRAVKLNSSQQAVLAGTGTQYSTEKLTFSRTSTGGTETLDCEGITGSVGVSASAGGFTAAALLAALESLPQFNVGDWVVTGSAGGPLVAEAVGREGENLPTISIGGDATGGTVTVDVTTAGGTADATSTHGERIAGIIQNNPAAVGRGTTVMLDGVSKAVAAGTIAVNDKVKTTTGGEFIAVSDTEDDIAVGVAETAASSGELFSIRFSALGA